MQNGIPIYVDPKGLNEAEKTMQSPVQLSLEGTKLKTSLRLMLDQLDLAYYVKDGLLVISAPTLETFPISALPPRQRAERAAELEIRQLQRKQALKRIQEGKMPMGGGGFQ